MSTDRAGRAPAADAPAADAPAGTPGTGRPGSPTGRRTALYRRGRIHRHPEASALVTEGGRIAWLGTEAQALAQLDSVDEVVDLGGAWVAAAFVDAHVHLSQTGAGLRGVDLGAARSATEALRLVEDGARARRGRPVYAPNWDESSWTPAALFTAAQLDRASYGGVIYAPRIDGHSAVISSALASASGAAQQPGWLGQGLVTREAHHVAREAFAAGTTRGERADDIQLALRRAAAAGIALLHENGGPVLSSAEDFADVLAAGERADLPDVIGYWAERVEDERRARDLAGLHGARGLAGDLNIDGSIGSRTAHLRKPYADGPTTEHRGNAYLTVGQVRDHVAACSLAGLPAGFHVIGDAGADTVIAGIEAAAGLVGEESVRAAGHRLEHLEMVDADGIGRLARLGVMASVQPAFDAFWGGPDGMYAARLGRERVPGTNPFRSMLQAGLVVGFGSDSPVTPFAPWEAIQAAVGHHDPGQRISARAAFAAHTVGGWRLAGIDGGRLDVGRPATFAAWETGELADGLPVLGDGGPGVAGGDTAPAARLTVSRGRVIHDAAVAPGSPDS